MAVQPSGGPPPKFLDTSEEEGDEEEDGSEVVGEEDEDEVGEVDEDDGGSEVAGEEEEALGESVGDVEEVGDTSVKLEVKDEPFSGDYEVGYSCFPYSVLLHSFPLVSGS